MKAAYVGCGSHARTLKRAFEAVGVETLCHARRSREQQPEPGFGELRTIADLLTCSDVDLYVVAAPHRATSAIACELARRGKRVVATKPLSIFPTEPLLAPFSVDLWRLFSDPYMRLAEEVAQRESGSFRGPEAVRIRAVGAGPFRPGLPGPLDWGPHALAFFYELFPSGFAGEPAVTTYSPVEAPEGGRTITVTGGAGDGCLVDLVFGNAGPVPSTSIFVKWSPREDWTLVERDGEISFTKSSLGEVRTIASCTKTEALESYARAAVDGRDDCTLELMKRSWGSLQRWCGQSESEKSGSSS